MIDNLTGKQLEVVRHCNEYTFVHADDLWNGRFSRRVINTLVSMGILEYHPAMCGDDEMWDLTSAAYSALQGVK